MIRLSRETRFALVPLSKIDSAKPNNSWAGWPSTNLIVPHLRLQMVVSGVPDATTGYLCNIKIIDEILRRIVTKRIIPIYDGTQTAEQLIRLVAREVIQGWPEALASPMANASKSPPIVELVTLHVTPFLKYSIQFANMTTSLDNSQTSGDSMIELTQQFEFSAAHRLHCNELSDQQNRELFGKCNNKEGHGHNYVIEVSVAAEVDSDQGQVTSLDRFESTVKRLVIDRLDHKHLNRDVEYFADVNPSVENIAIAIYRWLDGQLGSNESGAVSLSNVKVYETPKTWAEFCG